MHRILVTGGHGFIGRSLVQRLLSAGNVVVALVRNPDGGEDQPNLEQVQCDLEAGLPEDDEIGPFDAVVHAAHSDGKGTDARRMFSVNVRSTFELLEAAHRAGAQSFCYLSSGSVYGFGPRPWKETDLARGTTFYARSKLAAESLVLAFDEEFDVAVLRLFAPYGARQKDRLIPTLVDRVTRESVITVPKDGGFRINPIHVDDCVTAITDALEAGPVGVLNVGGHDTVSVRDLVVRIGAAAKVQPTIEAVGEASKGDLVGDISALEKDRRFAGPRIPLDVGLANLISHRDPEG